MLGYFTENVGMDLFELLQILELWNFFPEKLKRVDLFSAKLYNVYSEQLKRPPSLQALEYINDITHFQGNCRNIRKFEQKSLKSYKENRKTKAVEHNITSEIHPLDISTAVFLCCNNVARQDLVHHFWGCRHAFPLVIKSEQLEPPKLYIWPMNCLHFASSDLDKPILDYTMKAVSALRFGKQVCSKSHLLNLIIGNSEKVHPSFFSRDCNGSIRQKSQICNGMIEAMPFLHSKNGPGLYLNLRGNSLKCQQQTEFLMRTSDCIILLCEINESKILSEFVCTHFITSDAILIIVFTDLDADDENEALHSEIESLTDKLSVKNHVIPYKNFSHPDLIEEIWAILGNINGTCTRNKIIAAAETTNILVDLDATDETLKAVVSLGDKTVQKFREETIFPLQGNESLQWSRANLEIYQLRRWKSNVTSTTSPKETIHRYRENLEVKKDQLRKKQMEMIMRDESFIVREFIEKMDSAEHGLGLDLEILLRGLKLHFDKATRSSLKDIIKQYIKLMNQHKLEKSNTKEIENQLEKKDELYNSMSLSLTVFTREMGQMYETIVSQMHLPGTDIPRSVSQENLAKKAVTLLLHGYQVELMDGRTNNVPIQWIQGVLQELHNRLKNVRIKVISVLGVQSSGKSTLLNVMFGSQFDVSSGRCTRGVQMHLVKVSAAVAEEYLVDYLIILDTEGLFSTNTKWEKGERKHEERELATFVIGLSHITILNIMGENMVYLRDILSISVLAFLRMDLAGLNSRCVLVRHGVDTTKKDVLHRQTYSLEHELDLFTAEACELVHEPKRRFKDIISFDIAEDDYCFPTFYEYNNENEIVSASYSKAAMQLKQNLLTDVGAYGKILQLRSHIGFLWSAIKRDDYIYEFRNTNEIEARAFIDKKISYLQWLIRRELQRNTAIFQTQIANCQGRAELDQIKDNYTVQMRKMVKEQEEKNHEELQKIGVPNTLLLKVIQRLRDTCQEKLQKTIDECKTACDAQFQRDLHHRKTEIMILEKDGIVLNQIDVFIEEHIENAKVQHADFDRVADFLFECWCNSQWTCKIQNEPLDFKADALNCIYSTFFAYRAIVDDILKERGVLERDIDIFLSSSVSCHTQETMVQEVIKDSYAYVERLIRDMKSMKLFYQGDIFSDILLEVRNHKHLYKGKLHLKPNFEIELAISVCGEFIKKAQEIGKDKNFMSQRLMENTAYHFKNVCRKKNDCETNADGLVEAFTIIICEEMEEYILKILPQEITIGLKQKYLYLTSKQGLICHTWITLLNQGDDLHNYINSSVTAFENHIARTFDDFTKGLCEDQISQIHMIVRNCVKKYLGVVSERLLKASKSLEVKGYALNSREMVTCVGIIIETLDDMLVLSKFRVFENDRLNEKNTATVISRLSANLQEQPLASRLERRCLDSVLNAQFDAVRHATVREILENILGCKETCPFCGEICCIGQDHSNEHRALMHKPPAFQEIITGISSEISQDSCWERCERHRSSKTEAVRRDWIIPSDITPEDNSFWKCLFVSWIKDTGLKARHGSIDIPDSWKMLSKSEERKKLEIMLEGIIEL